ncbi:MAG: ribbon-helix-helix protein, CopG family [Chloroflexota bacterium]|jgi:hypothetical protein
MATVVYSLRLPVEVYEELKAEAARSGKDLAQVVREAVTTYLAHEGVVPSDDPIWRLADIAEELGGSGIPDGSIHHDRYLYGRGPV